MQVLLDGKPVAVARPTIAEALRAAVAQAHSQGRIIIEATADGVTLSDEQLANPSDTPGTIVELKLASADPRSLVRVTLLDAVDALDGVQKDQGRASELVQSGQLGPALESLQAILLTWQAVRDVIDRSAAVLSLDLDHVDLRGIDPAAGFGPATTALLTHLGAVKSALSGQDWSALSDAIGYDLDGDVRVWQALLRALAEHVQTLPKSGPAAAGDGAR